MFPSKPSIVGYHHFGKPSYVQFLWHRSKGHCTWARAVSVQLELMVSHIWQSMSNLDLEPVQTECLVPSRSPAWNKQHKKYEHEYPVVCEWLHKGAAFQASQAEQAEQHVPASWVSRICWSPVDSSPSINPPTISNRLVLNIMVWTLVAVFAVWGRSGHMNHQHIQSFSFASSFSSAKKRSDQTNISKHITQEMRENKNYFKLNHSNESWW